MGPRLKELFDLLSSKKKSLTFNVTNFSIGSMFQKKVQPKDLLRRKDVVGSFYLNDSTHLEKESLVKGERCPTCLWHRQRAILQCQMPGTENREHSSHSLEKMNSVALFPSSKSSHKHRETSIPGESATRGWNTTRTRSSPRKTASALSTIDKKVFCEAR